MMQTMGWLQWVTWTAGVLAFAVVIGLVIRGVPRRAAGAGATLRRRAHRP